MPNCVECGSVLREGAKFCPKCGSRQESGHSPAAVSEADPSDKPSNEIADCQPPSAKLPSSPLRWRLLSRHQLWLGSASIFFVAAIVSYLLRAPTKTKAPQQRHSEVVGLAINQDAHVMAALYSDGKIRVWNPSTGKLIRTIQYRVGVKRVQVYLPALALSPDGVFLASLGDDGDTTVWLWDVQSGKCIRTFYGHTAGVVTIVFSPDGTLLASTSYGSNGKVIVWEVATGRERWHSSFEATALAFSRNGRLLATGDSESTIRLSDVSNGTVLFRSSGGLVGAPVIKLCFTPDEQAVVAAHGDWTLRFWKTSVMSSASDRELRRIDDVTALAFSPDGQSVALGVRIGYSSSSELTLWGIPHGDGASGTEGVVLNNLAFSAEGQVLAAGARDGSVWLYDARTLTPLKTFRVEAASLTEPWIMLLIVGAACLAIGIGISGRYYSASRRP